MVLKLHLHANFPHALHTPNPALGYLKSALSQENVDIKNVYWYLMPQHLLRLVFPTFARLQSTHIHKSYASSLLAAYFARFLYEDKKMVDNTVIGSLLTSRNLRENAETMAKMFKTYMDDTIENEHMADVDIAGFTVKLYQWFTNAYVWSRLKALNPNITIVVGGLDTPQEAVAFMETFNDIDFAVWGEGEVPLRELVKRHTDRQSLNEVPQLVYRGKNGVLTTDVVSDGVTPTYFADHTDFFNQYKAFNLFFPVQIPIYGTRYCRWNRCKFCNFSKDGVYYERPVPDIIKEIEYQSKKFGVLKFIFLDSDIGRKNEKDFETLLTLLLDSAARRKKLYDIIAEISPIRLKRQYAAMMSNIKMSVQIGFEALTDPLLKNMDKMHRFAENVQALKFGSDYGLDLPGLNILRNLPGTSQKDVMESMENLEFLRFFLKKYRPRPSDLGLYKRARYYKDVPQKERETVWVINLMYAEFERLGLIKDTYRWDFFGFRAHSLHHFQLWDQLSTLLEQFFSSTIHYSWLEFPDGSSLFQEYNGIRGNKEYFLDEVTTAILKFCDEITPLKKVKDTFPHQDVEAIVSHLKNENLLYYDEERNRLLSILSIKALKKMK